MDLSLVLSLLSGSGFLPSVGIVIVIVLLWRELRALRTELTMLLREQEKRLARIEDKVFPTHD